MAYADSPTLIAASGMPSEPPDADPHVQWYVQRLIMLSARSARCVLPAEHDFGW